MSDAAISFGFSDGLLSIRAPQMRVRLGWRPYPVAEEWLPARRDWCSFRPDFRVIRAPAQAGRGAGFAIDVPTDSGNASLAEQKAGAFAAFRNEVDPDIVRVVEPFGSYQWSLMLAARRHKPVLELAGVNPVLAYALANSDELLGTAGEETVRNIRLKCTLKQREIAGWLGFPETEAMVRLLKRIPPEVVSPSVLRCLRQALARGPAVAELLLHVKVFTVDVLELVTNKRLLGFVTPKLLLEVGERVAEGGEASVADMIADGVRVLDAMELPVEVRPFSTILEVRRFREDVDKQYEVWRRRQEEATRARRLAEATRLRVLAEKENVAFPPPPFPGTYGIVPLTTVRALVEEGRQQSNCVSSYRWLVLQGGGYIYRILAPERATLLIAKTGEGLWRRRELAGKGNVSVRQKTIAMVDAWLAEQQPLS